MDGILILFSYIHIYIYLDDYLMKYISYKEVINIVICGECGEREGWLKNTSANSMLLLKKISFFPHHIHTIFAKSCLLRMLVCG